MKIAVKGVIPVLCLFMAMPLLRAQNNNSSTVRTGVVGSTNNTSSSSISVRAKSLYEKEAISPADIPWMRVIYRSLDLKEEKNMPLYYPEEPTENQENLFRLIMRLLTENKIVAYEYLDGREVFTDQYKMNLKDLLDKFHILYEEKEGRTSKSTRYLVNESDVPSNEVLSYYIREKWIFDQRNSGLTSVIEAICPILHRVGDFGGDAMTYPMFWIKYDDLRPYMAQQYILTNNENNVQNYTYDDYFKMRMFEGKIYKTTNLRNMSLMQLYDTAEKQDSARAGIEKQLQNFENSLGVKSPAPVEQASKDTDKKKRTASSGQNATEKEVKSSVRSSRGTTTSRSSVKSGSSKSVKSKSSRSSSSKSAPIRSVRRTR